MTVAQKKLDRYYSLTDTSSVYRIAMVLHLGMRLEYFRQHDWEEEWIDQAENLVCEEYIATYEKETILTDDEMDRSLNEVRGNSCIRCCPC